MGTSVLGPRRPRDKDSVQVVYSEKVSLGSTKERGEMTLGIWSSVLLRKDSLRDWVGYASDCPTDRRGSHPWLFEDAPGVVAP